MEEQLRQDIVANTDRLLEDYGRDIPGETGLDHSGQRSGFSVSLQQLSGNVSSNFVQTSGASPLLRRSRNDSDAQNMEPLLFSPIRMLDFEEVVGTENNSRSKIPVASLSKSSTPNPKSAVKSGKVVSPDQPKVLSVDEMDASPILPEHYMESAMDRELECRLIDAGHMGEESPSDRGSRERSPVIDGAEHEDTIQNRFQMMAAQPARQDVKTKVYHKKSPKDSAPPQMYPIRMGPNHGNDGLSNYKITRPSNVQGMAEGDAEAVKPVSQKPWQPQYSTFPQNFGQPFFPTQFGGNKQQQLVSGRLGSQESGSGPFLRWSADRGGNYQHQRGDNSHLQSGNNQLYNVNQNQCAAVDKLPYTVNMRQAVPSKGYDFQDTLLSKFSSLMVDESSQNSFNPQRQAYLDFNSLPQTSPVTGELLMFNQSEGKDMEEVLGHMQKVIQQGQAIVGNVEPDSDGISDLLTGQGHGQGHPLQGHPPQGHRLVDVNISPKSQGSTAWFEVRSNTDQVNPHEDGSPRIWGDNSSRYQSDPTLVAENRILKETVEKERYRRKHCENHIHQLNSKLLEAQQQLAVVVAQSNKKDAMVEQLDKQFAQVVDGWKRKEADSEEVIKKLKAEKNQMGASLEQQGNALKKFESDLSVVVEELREERETAALTIEKLNTQLGEQSREMTNLLDQLSTEKDRAQHMTSEWERAKEGRDLAEVKVENLQDQLHKEQDNWYRKEKELLQKMDELTDSKLRAIQEERKRTEEKTSLVRDVEEQLKMIMTEMEKLEKELDATVREKESLKVEMSLKEARNENSLKQLEADLKYDYERRLSEKMVEVGAERDALEQKLITAHRQHAEELTNQNRAELLRQTNHYEDLMKEKAEQDYQEFSKKLTELQNENAALKIKKQKLEIQRTEVLSKLQLLMQSQWNEALSILGTSSPHRAHQSSNATTQQTAPSTSSLLAGLNLSANSQPPSSGSSTTEQYSNNTPSKGNFLAVLNNNNGGVSSQHNSLPSHNPQDESSWHHAQQSHNTNNLIGPSSLPAALSDLLNFTSQSNSSKNSSNDNQSLPSVNRSQYSQGIENSNGIASFRNVPQNSVYPSSAAAHTSPHRSTPKHLHGGQPTSQNNLVGYHSAEVSKQRFGPETLKRKPENLRTVESGKFGHPDPTVMSHSNHFQGNSVTSQDNFHPGSMKGSHNSNFHSAGNAALNSRFQDNHYHGGSEVSHSNLSVDISMLSSIQDVTLNSHQVGSYLKAHDQSSQAVPIRPPQQRSRTTEQFRGRDGRPERGQRLRGPNRSHSVDDNNQSSPGGSDEVISRLRECSDDNASCSENQSEPGLGSGPLRLEFSPPTKQPRPPGVRTSSDWSGSEGQENSVLDETLRLNEEYSHISDKLDKHESRQSELQHYIQMLLERSPGSPTSPVAEGRTGFEGPNNSLASNTHLPVPRGKAKANEDSSTSRQKLSTKQGVMKSPRQEVQNPGSLECDQLAEISQLLMLYRSHDRDEQHSPGANQLLELLQGLRQRQDNQASPQVDSKGDNSSMPSDVNRAMRPAGRRAVDKNKKVNPVKQTNLNGATRDIGRSSSVERGSAKKQAQGKKPERKFSAGTSQNRTAVPKWR